MDIYGNSNDDINDATLTNTILKGSTTIVCDDNTTYNLQTPDNGDNLEVLTTDGNGNIYWSNGGGGNPFNQTLNTTDNVNFNIVTSNSFVKVGGTNQQYLMGDGTSLQYSANSGNSNFYLYNNVSGVMTPPPANGQVGYNNSVQANATILYISHRTRDTIDIDVFLEQLSTVQDVYLQDQENSLNFIRYNITATPTLITNSYISIPVSYTATIPPALPNGGGTGLTNFGVNHNILVSFFTNSIEVDTRLTTLETKTQNQTAIPNTTTILGTTNINSVLTPYNQTLKFDHFSLINRISSYAYNETQVCSLGITALQTDFNGIVNCNNGLTSTSLICSGNSTTRVILPETDNLYDIGNTAFRFQRGYFGTGIRSPIYDTQNLIELKIAPQYANQVTIGRDTVTTTILGTTSINSVYTLPNTAPAIGNVLTCSALGVSSWITPSPTAYSFLYPFPVISKTVVTGAGTRTLACAYTMTTNFTFANTGVFLPSPGSDLNRVGIYRGDLLTGVLVGQTGNFAPTANYNVKPLIKSVGQSLAFTLGEQIVLVWTQSGSGTSIATTTGVSNIALAFLSGTGYTSVAFPTTMAGFASPSATTIRMCIDLS